MNKAEYNAGWDAHDAFEDRDETQSESWLCGWDEAREHQRECDADARAWDDAWDSN